MPKLSDYELRPGDIALRDGELLLLRERRRRDGAVWFLRPTEVENSGVLSDHDEITAVWRPSYKVESVVVDQLTGQRKFWHVLTELHPRKGEEEVDPVKKFADAFKARCRREKKKLDERGLVVAGHILEMEAKDMEEFEAEYKQGGAA